MDITPLIPSGRQVITGYGAGGFTVNGGRVEGSIIIFPDHTLAWDVQSTSLMTLDALAYFFRSPLGGAVSAKAPPRLCAPLAAPERKRRREQASQARSATASRGGYEAEEFTPHASASASGLASAAPPQGGSMFPIELLLIGTGHVLVPLPQEIRQALRAQGITVEVMDTGAACRTYNVLLAEERRVAAALVAI